MEEVRVIESATALEAINRAECDIQIATAKAYPRELNKVLNTIATYATMDKETAEDCFYVLRRKDARGQDSVIEGLSVRMAEIIASAWGNLRIQTRVIGNDGRMITAQAMCHDLESNVAVSKEVRRRITTKEGRTYSDDMQVVTGNAACSIAYRNAVLSVIPKAVTKKIISEVKKVAMGQSIDIETARARILSYYNKLGVTADQLMAYLGIGSVEEIDQKTIFELRALRNAIEEGDTTVKEAFGDHKDAKKAAESVKKAVTAKDKALAALEASKEPQPEKAGETSEEEGKA